MKQLYNLDLNSVKELPDSHSWTSSTDHHQCPYHYHSSSSSSSTESSLPVIDLNDPNVLKLLGYACKTWGAFQIKNHGIPISLLQTMEAVGRNLFSLPIQQKLKAARSPDCVSGYGVARISSFFPKLMWSEGFTIVGSPLQHARKLWPQDYANFCDVIREYETKMKKLAGKLMWLMLGSLGISKEEEVEWAGELKGGSSCSGALQLNSYPTCPDPDRAMGLAAHTDSTLFTILHQSSNTSGLQVFRERSGWVSVPPVDGALVINVGDLFHILSNGLYPSVLHRVVVNRNQHRLSIAYLYGPPNNVQISPLSKLLDHYHPPLYRPVTWSEYLGTKAKHFNNALSSLRSNMCSDSN